MPRDASGTYTKPDGTTAVTGQIISSSAYNNLANDEATALTDSLSRSGKGGMQADLSMGGKKVTNVAAGAANADAVRLDQIYGTANATTTGTSTAYLLALDPAIASYATGRHYSFVAHIDNTTTSPTLSINGKGPKAMRRPANVLLTAGDIQSGQAYEVVDIGSTFEVTNLLPALGTAATRDVGTASGNLTEIVNGSGQFNAAVDAAHKALDNLAGNGLKRVIWAALAFVGATGAPFNNFNGATVARNGVGLYTITFPNIGSNDFNVQVMMDVAPSTSGTNCNVVSGSRSVTSVQISCRSGNTTVDPFDPDIVTVTITKIG